MRSYSDMQPQSKASLLLVLVVIVGILGDIVLSLVFGGGLEHSLIFVLGESILSLGAQS